MIDLLFIDHFVHTSNSEKICFAWSQSLITTMTNCYLHHAWLDTIFRFVLAMIQSLHQVRSAPLQPLPLIDNPATMECHNWNASTSINMSTTAAAVVGRASQSHVTLTFHSLVLEYGITHHVALQTAVEGRVRILLRCSSLNGAHTPHHRCCHLTKLRQQLSRQP